MTASAIDFARYRFIYKDFNSHIAPHRINQDNVISDAYRNRIPLLFLTVNDATASNFESAKLEYLA